MAVSRLDSMANLAQLTWHSRGFCVTSLAPYAPGCSNPRQTRQRPPVNRSESLLSKHVSKLTIGVGLYLAQSILPAQLKYEVQVW